jgi:nucleotide-binding universal stress UspA family protein
MRKLLIGIHDKTCSLRAVAWVMKQYTDPAELEVLLAHVFPDLPTMYWDDGHVLSADEDKDRKKVIDTWMERQRDYVEPILEGAAGELVRRGIPRERVATKFVLGTSDVADSLLDEAAAGKFGTIVVGRCGIADGRHFLVGSVVSKLIQKAAGVAVVVVQ